MQNTTSPASLYKGCSIRGLPITAPFRIQYETKDRESEIGLFIILPFNVTVPRTQVYDFTIKQCNAKVHCSLENPDVVQKGGQNDRTESGIEEIDSEMTIKTEPDASVYNSFDVTEYPNIREMNFMAKDCGYDSLPFKTENEITRQTDTLEYGIIYTSNGDMKLNFTPVNAALDTAVTGEGKGRDHVRLKSPVSDYFRGKKKTCTKLKKSRKKKNADRNNDNGEEMDSGLPVKKKKRQRTEENSQVTEMMGLKRVKVEEDDKDEPSKRKSTRLRSVGFRPDYQDVEHKIDELVYYIEDYDTHDTQWEFAEDDGDESFIQETKENEVETKENEVNERSGPLKTGNDDLKNTMLGTKTEDRRCTDPDYDPEEFVKPKQTRNKRSNEIKMEINDVKERSELEDENSDSDTDDSGTNLKVRKKISKQKQENKWIHIKLEEHQDKYKQDILESFARKDRGKSETERFAEVYVCTLCNKFKSEGIEGIENHLEQHLNGKLDCKQCDFSASNFRDLSLHKKEEHRDENGRMCPLCGIQIRADTLKDHIGTVHKDPQHECKYCLKNKGERIKFCTRRELRKHSADNHRDLGFICQFCEKVYFNNKKFETHKLSCNGNKEMGCYCCERCGVKLSTEEYLKFHIETVHLKIKKFQCTECPYAAVKRRNLTRHMLVHKGIHPFNCPECDFTCVQSYQLTSHMRTHTGEKPFKCTQCKYAAAWNVQLKEHTLVHNMETAVMCQNCDILFKNERTLNMHLKKQQCMM